MNWLDRRGFLQSSLAVATTAVATPLLHRTLFGAKGAEDADRADLKFGLVTYQWGADWDLPTLLKNCGIAGARGVELRTTHAHRVEPALGMTERAEVKKRFANSPVTLVGIGSNEAFHHDDPEALKIAIKRTKEFIKLSHDVGSSGVKVKPNDLPKKIPHEKTIDQIGRTLNELGKFAADYGQQVRLEVHGDCSPLPIIAAIMNVAENPQVTVCWNSNAEDLESPGLPHNFRFVANRLADTVHVRGLDDDVYPYEQLFQLLNSVAYKGWILIEASDKPADRVRALQAQRAAFEKLCAS